MTKLRAIYSQSGRSNVNKCKRWVGRWSDDCKRLCIIDAHSCTEKTNLPIYRKISTPFVLHVHFQF